MTVATAVVTIIVDARAFAASINKVRKSMASTAKQIDRAAGGIVRSFAKVGIAVGLAGAAAIKMASNFEKGITEIGTLMGGLADGEMRAMRQRLRQDFPSRDGRPHYDLRLIRMRDPGARAGVPALRLPHHWSRRAARRRHQSGGPTAAATRQPDFLFRPPMIAPRMKR